MKNAVIKSLYESMSMLRESYEHWTEEDWAKKLKKVCHLNKEEADDLLHDLNNLRGNEWLEIVEDNCDDEKLLIAFKEFIGANDIWEDEFDESLNESLSLKESYYIDNDSIINKDTDEVDATFDVTVNGGDVIFKIKPKRSLSDAEKKSIIRKVKSEVTWLAKTGSFGHIYSPVVYGGIDESLKEDYNSDLETERKIQKYLDDHNLWGEVSVQDGTVYVEIHWGDWKHDHWYCQDLMSELGYVLVGKEVTEEDGSDTFSAIHTYEKMDVTNESLSLKKSINESPDAKDIAPDVLDYREKMQNAMKTRVREWGVNSITHFGHAVDNTHNELLELEQDGLFSKEAFNKTYALKCISSIINYVENDVLSKLYEYKSYIENK